VVSPVATASLDGGAARVLAEHVVSSGHFSFDVSLTPGTWRLRVVTPFGTRRVAFTERYTIS
jgi:hypothetical protein